MIENSQLETILVNSLKDFKLDQDEKYLLQKMAAELAQDQLNFVRNKAFDLCHSHIESGGVKAFKALNWLERVVKVLQPAAQNVTVKSSVFFSPGQDCKNKIIRLIKGAKKEIDICVFTISDNGITKAILEAHDRRVKVTIISDNDKSNDRGSDIDLLSSRGINVLLDNTRYHMHHKFALFDKRILLNGSFNWTRSASEVNEENILVTNDKKMVTAFNKQFERLKTQFSS